MPTDSAYWVLPVINDIIDFAEKHGLDELRDDLNGLAAKHFPEGVSQRAAAPRDNVVRLKEVRRR